MAFTVNPLSDLYSILDVSGRGVIVLDQDFAVQYWNDWLIRHSGYPTTQVIGRSFFEIFPSQAEKRLGNSIRLAVEKGQSTHLSHVLNRRLLPLFADLARQEEANALSQNISIKPIATQTGATWCYIEVQDVSGVVRRETALREARERAITAERTKSDFLALMSHEIRTPLNGILGMARLLADSDLTDEQQEYVTALTNSGSALVHLLSDVLDLSKLEAGQLVINAESISIGDLIRDVLQLFQTSAGSESIFLKCEVDPTVPAWIETDGIRVRQILTNLVSNAVKFTQIGGITVSATKSGDDMFTLTVSDTGTGIPEDELTHLFDPYVQAPSGLSLNQRGTGLGLAIVREFSARLGGSARVESTFGVGTSFHVTLPCIKGKAPKKLRSRRRKTDSSTENAAGRRIMLIEDNPVNRLFFTALLKKEGHESIVAEDGVKALEMVRSGTIAPVDLLLIDINMPNLDGMETLAGIRDLGKPWSGIPAIALTAHALAEEKQAFLDAGFDDYEPKPVDVDRLLAKIGRLALSTGNA